MNREECSIVVKKGRAQPLWQKHPWIYAGAIEKVNGAPQPGSLVAVYDHELRLIGRGFYNPRSQITVRMFTYKDEPLDRLLPFDRSETAIEKLIASRLQQAAALRQRLHLPSAETDAFRLVHSEGDRLPGLTIDLYADTAVVQFTILGMKLREEAVFAGLLALPKPFRPQTLIEVAVPRFAQLEGFSSMSRVVSGSLSKAGHEGESIICKEGGLRFQAEPLQSQKTGMFLDQRENRIQLGKYCAGMRFLDMYSYTGGFALQALRQGAASAVCVDSSAKALQKVELHAKLNGLIAPQTVEMDAFRYLETVTPYSFDVVVVDPPKFASAQKDMATALKGYRRLNALAMNAVVPGGLLASCSCSQLVDTESFERMLAAAAVDAGRNVSILESRSQAPDHPVPPSFPEGSYLKFVLLSVA